METNFTMLRHLDKRYAPYQKGIITEDEVKLITEMLHIGEMDVLQLRNLRDFTVMYYSMKKENDYMDKISAITHLIDCQIIQKGGEV